MKKKERRALSPFEKQWLKIFASNVAKKDLEQHVTCTGGFIWHVFSWELLPGNTYLSGENARKAFDSQEKSSARYYEPWPVNGPHEPFYNSPTSAELDELTECYVLAADESWTYIKTHENDLCGPYFAANLKNIQCEE